MMTQPSNTKPPKMLNPRHWFWAAIAFSLSVCAFIVFMHYKQKELLSSSAQTIDSFRQARIDLAKGFLYCGLSEDPQSPFSREEGLAYITQAVISIKHNLTQANVFAHTQENKYTQLIQTFIEKSDVFQVALKNWNTSDTINAVAELKLKIDYHELEKMANQVDGIITLQFNQTTHRSNLAFAVLVSLAALALTAICTVLFIAVMQQKKAQRALNESELNLRKLFDHMLNGLAYCKVIKDEGQAEDFLFLGVNQSFEKLTGLHDVVGKKMSDILPSIWKTDRPILNLIERVAFTGETESSEVYVNAFEQWFALRVYSTRPDHFLMVFDVITERMESEQLLKQKNDEIEAQNEEYRQINEELKEAKKRAEESDRLKTAFLANMSHEIRTPMNAIVGFAEFIVNPLVSADKKEWYASIIKSRSYDLLRIIEDILDVSRIEVGQLSIMEAPTNIAHTLHEIFEFYKEKLTASEQQSAIDLKLKIDTPVNQLYVVTDEQRLKQVLNNLMDNALKFTHQGTVELGCQRTPNHTLTFYVRDTGIGIAPEKLGIVFDRFRQAEDAMTVKQYGGTGLGLSIVKGLVELLGGRVWVKSEPGKGSTFFVELPLLEAQEPQADDSKNKELKLQTADAPLKIMVVEDDPMNMEYLREVLSKPELEIFSATNGEKALKFLVRYPGIKLILMDVRLPDINGLELTRFIKKEYPWIKVIAQTAYASNFDRYECLQAGCDDYLAKPIAQESLMTAITKLMN